MSDIVNALKGFPFEQFFCLLLFGIVIWILRVLNTTLIKLERTIFAHTFVIDKAMEKLDKCHHSGKPSS